MDQEKYKLITDYRGDLILNFTNNKQKIKFNLNEYYRDIKQRIQTNLKKEPLFLLLEPKKVILDGTSGLLQDSLILAAFSKKVIAYEVSAEIYNLQIIIKDEIFNKDPFYRNLIDKIDMRPGNSVACKEILMLGINAIYVDLMFDDTKKSQPKKSKQLLRMLANNSNNYSDFITLSEQNHLRLLIKSNNKNLAKTEPNLLYSKIGNLYYYSLNSN
jgi:hypothetical protein